MRALIVADDFTGANATGILMKKRGFEVTTFLNEERFKAYGGDCRILCVNTDSRSDRVETAYHKVNSIYAYAKDKFRVISKRIDTTLRGNVGIEIEGALDALGDDYKALVVPCFPGSKRVTVGGYMLVDGKALESTGVAMDPKTPIKTSIVRDIIGEKCRRKIAEVGLHEVLRGEDYLKERLTHIKEQIIIFDALSDEDIKTIAKAAVKCGEPFIPVDPGPFTSEVIDLTISKNKELKNECMNKNRVLLVVGSTTEITRSQIMFAKLHKNMNIFEVNPRTLLRDPSGEKAKAIEHFIKDTSNNHFCITTTLKNTDILNLMEISKEMGLTEQETALRIGSELSMIGKEIKDSFDFIKSVYISGGDMVQEFFKIIGAESFELLDEIIPLAVYGIVRGGEYDGMKMITKGGLIGDEKTLEIIMSYLESR